LAALASANAAPAGRGEELGRSFAG
jgi:hypothetical protein